ncbi:MAG TPA: FkbM family methyltransferase [Paludibaculum sp.]|jgi:FkbM family methyltransferase
MTKSEFYRDVLLAQTKDAQWFDFEGLIRDAYQVILRPGDLSVDVGANIGVHAFQMAEAVYPGGRVIAVEAVAELIEGMREAGRRYYPQLLPLISFENVALSDHEGQASFCYCPKESGLSSLVDRAWVTPSEKRSIDVRVTRLDDLLAGGGGGRVRFIKVDVEGGEFHVLKGAKLTLAKDRPIVVFEHAEWSPGDFGYCIEEMREFFAGLDYQVFDVFGLPYDRLDDWSNMLVWTFFAVPSSELEDGKRIFDVVQKSLAAIGIHYQLSDVS